ncbi:MAG: 4Fe-4S dicluster domain-containing protein [Elusimicrobiota bacterium]
MPFQKPKTFLEDYQYEIETHQLDVTPEEFKKIDELLEKMMDVKVESNTRAEDFRRAIKKEFGIDLGINVGTTSYLALPVGVAPATYSQTGLQVENIAKIGIPFVGLKTLVCESEKGDASCISESRGNVWNPDKEILDWPMFLTGERASKYKVDEYIEKVLLPATKVAEKYKLRFSPSMIGPEPLVTEKEGDRSGEWVNTTDKIAKSIKKYVEATGVDVEIGLDFPPYFVLFVDLGFNMKKVDEYFNFLVNSVVDTTVLCQKVIDKHGLGEKVKITPKLSAAMMDVMGTIAVKLQEKSVDKLARFICFNRELGDHVFPLSLETVPSGYSGPGHRWKSSRYLHLLSKNTGLKYEATFTGGVYTGKDVISVISSGNIGKVEIVSSFYTVGIRHTYKRIIGGLAAGLLHLSRTSKQKYGVEISSVDQLKNKANELRQPATEKRWKTDHVKYVAVINHSKCRACKQKTPGFHEEGQCQAMDLCPMFAYYPVREENGKIKYWEIDPKKCIGCGTCIPKNVAACPGEAISLKKV